MKPCPKCGTVGTITVTPTLTAKPLGSHSLSGAQMKVSAIAGAVLACSACDLQIHGRLENAQLVDGTFTGGHFIADTARQALGHTEEK